MNLADELLSEKELTDIAEGRTIEIGFYHNDKLLETGTYYHIDEALCQAGYVEENHGLHEFSVDVKPLECKFHGKRFMADKHCLKCDDLREDI